MPEQQSIWSSYKLGWKSLLCNWRAILLSYLMTLFLAFIGMGPLSNILKKAVEGTVYQDKINLGFDYTLFSEILREFNTGVSISLILMLSLMVPMFLWSVFVSGGFMALIQQYPNKTPLTDFWRGGAYYFFRYLRLGIYLMACFGLVVFLCLTLLNLGEISPFSLESEGPLITKFWLILCLLGFMGFLLGVFRDLAKINIAKLDEKLLLTANKSAFQEATQLGNLSLCFLNLFTLAIFGALYFFIKKLFSSYLWPVIILGQIFLLGRIAYKYARVASLYTYNRNHDEV